MSVEGVQKSGAFLTRVSRGSSLGGGAPDGGSKPVEFAKDREDAEQSVQTP